MLTAAKSHQSSKNKSEPSPEKTKRNAKVPQQVNFNPLWHRFATQVSAKNNFPPVQAKLTVGEPDDEYEKEADRVADQVMRMPAGAEALDEVQKNPADIQTKPLNSLLVQRMCSECAKEGSSTRVIQRKLSVGESNDPHEQEADTVADKVMRSPLNTGEKSESVQTKTLGITPIQRQCTECGYENNVQTKSESDSNSTPSTNNVQSAISSSTRGAPVPTNVLSRVEPVLGADLSGVQVHNNATSHSAASDINARAFTHKNSIYLAKGESANNVELMAHELTHTVQQSGGQSEGVIQRKPNFEVANDCKKAAFTNRHIIGVITGTSAVNPYTVNGYPKFKGDKGVHGKGGDQKILALESGTTKVHIGQSHANRAGEFTAICLKVNDVSQVYWIEKNRWAAEGGNQQTDTGDDNKPGAVVSVDTCPSKGFTNKKMVGVITSATTPYTVNGYPKYRNDKGVVGKDTSNNSITLKLGTKVHIGQNYMNDAGNFTAICLKVGTTVQVYWIETGSWQVQGAHTQAQKPTQGEAIKDAAGNVLPGDITVNWDGDPFKITFSRVEERGSPKFKVLVTYIGPHTVDFSDKTRTLTHDIGSKLLAASATVDDKHHEITIDLYGDKSRVITLKDKTEFRTLTDKPSRAHGFSLHYLGRMMHSAITMFVQAPGAKELPPTPEKEVPGEKPGFSIPAGSGELQALLDGDGDQYKELKMVVEKLDSYSSGDPKTVRITLRQRESGIGQQYNYTLSDGSGMIFPLVEQISDGRVPTKVALTISKSVSLTLNVPKVIKDQVQYTLIVGSQAVNYHFPSANYKPKPVFSGAISPILIGNIISYDLKVGAYQDPFRLTFRPKTQTAANLGFSPLSNNKPWGGQGITIGLPSTIALNLSKKSFSALSLDIDNDGKEDVAIHDELTTPADYDGGGPTESNRNHTFRFSGSAVSGEKALYYRIRQGRFAGGRNPGNTTQTAAEDIDALVEQRNQGSFNNQIDLYEQALMRTRKKAADAGLISQKTFEAWAGLSESMIQIRPQIVKGVNATLKKRAAAHASKFYDLFSHDTRFEDKLTGASQGGSTYSNPYTGTMSTIAPFYSNESGPGLRLQTAIKGDDWPNAFINYRKLVSGFDKWVLNRFEKDRSEHHAETKEVALLSKRMRELTEIEHLKPKRIYGVFHPSESMSGESGYVPHIPLALYYWKKDDTWYLKDITNPDHTYTYDTAATPGQLYPPYSLLAQMNDPDHFPIGMITYDIPGNRGGYINTTSPLTFKKFLSYLGLGLAAVGLTLSTFGTGTVAVIGAWTLAASAVATATSAGIDIVDHINRGNLTTTVALLNLGTIVASLAGAAALGSGQIVSAAGKATGAAKWSGNWAKLALMADRLFVPMVATTAAADVVTLAVFTVDAAKKLDTIENGTGDRASKDRAKLLLLAQLAVMGGLTALSVKGSLPNLKARRTLMLHEGPDGVPVISDSYNFFMSQPKVQAEFAKSAGMKELLEKNPEIVYRLMRDPDVRNVILSAPKIAESFAKHPKAIKFLDEVIEEVNRRGAAAILKTSSKPKPPSPTTLSTGQKTVSRELDAMVTKDPAASRQSGFDDSKIGNSTYLDSYLDDLYRDAKSAQSDLNKLTDKVATASGGKPGYRPEPKNRERSLQKIAKYGGDASRLNDLAGSKIVYNNLEDLYKGLAKVKEIMGGRLVAFKDRFIKPQASGYRDIQMSVKMDNGHIAEFRLHLSQIDAVADIEHAIYKVSRSFEPNAIQAGRQMSNREKAIQLVIREKTQKLYKGAMDTVPGQSP